MINEFSTPLNTSVAVFPLPDVAVIPGEVISLHLFEPRYRQMMADIETNNYLLGVSLAGQTLHAPEVKEDEDMRLRNLNLYEPNTIFGCGPTVVTQRYDDGRVMIDLYVKYKVEMREMIQTLPYYLARVATLPDETCTEALELEMKGKLADELVAFTSEYDVKAAQVILGHVQKLNQQELLAFALQLVRFDGEFKQQLLEQPQSLFRAQLIIEKLNEFYPDSLGRD